MNGINIIKIVLLQSYQIEDPDEKTARVVKAMIHPDYNEDLNFPDLAVLALDTTYLLTDNLRINLEYQQSINQHAAWYG